MAKQRTRSPQASSRYPATLVAAHEAIQKRRRTLDAARVGYFSFTGLISIQSNRVTLSALVHRATLPGPPKVRSVWVNSGLPLNDTVKRLPSARRASVC